MEISQALKQLRDQGKTNTAEIYRRHGVKGETWGVSYAALGALSKRIKQDHELALSLWETGVHDARVLATKIASPTEASVQQLNAWAKTSDNHVLEGAVANLAARSLHGLKLARKWSRQRSEWVSAAGFSVYAELALAAQIDKPEAEDLLELIEDTIGQVKNRTRHTMNGLLIAIGGSMPELSKPALQVAERIGPVEVDHGETGCKTPDARGYIEKMLARRKPKPKRSAKAKAKAKAKPAQATQVEVENINVPGSISRVNSAKYGAMKRALLKALPKRQPGLSQREMTERVKPLLPATLFPGGEKAAWWVKTVQLDLEAKGRVVRDRGRPLRWRRA